MIWDLRLQPGWGWESRLPALLKSKRFDGPRFSTVQLTVESLSGFEQREGRLQMPVYNSADCPVVGATSNNDNSSMAASSLYNMLN